MSRLITLLPFLTALAVVACASQARGDGLIYQLPPDGGWVRYRYAEEGEVRLPATNDKERAGATKNTPSLPFKSSGSLRLSSVGQVIVDGEPCRWIELKFEVEIGAKLPDSKAAKLAPKKETRRIVVKLLIPEKQLAAGADPLAHVRRLYFKDGDRSVELIEDDKAKQYEIDRFRPVFPKPAAKTAQLERQTGEVLETGLGKLKCEKLTFVSDYEGPLARGRRGWWSWRGKHEVWRNDQVPFGVAALKLAATSGEWSGDKGLGPKVTTESTKSLVVSESGEGAKTELPDAM